MERTEYAIHKKNCIVTRHVRGSRKRIPGSNPKDLDPGFVRIIDPTLTVCRQIHWDHRSAFAIRQEIHSDCIVFCISLNQIVPLQ